MNGRLSTAFFGQIWFCAEECRRQGSGEESVAWMCDALDFAETYGNDLVHSDGIDPAFIITLGQRVEPHKNVSGFRQTPVRIEGATQQPLAPDLIEQAVKSLCTAGFENMTPEEFYLEFEKIHPFIDGNGRVGAILYNFMKGTLDYPETPPEFGK